MSKYTLPRALRPEDDLSVFDSGEPSVDEWLRRVASVRQATGASRCFVTCRDGQVVGFYTLSAATVQALEATRWDGPGRPEPVPVILLARLAVDEREQGRGLGSQLLCDAVIRTVEAAEIVGVRALLAHAVLDSSWQFYLRRGFEPLPGQAFHLFLPIKDARALLIG